MFQIKRDIESYANDELRNEKVIDYVGDFKLAGFSEEEKKNIKILNSPKTDEETLTTEENELLGRYYTAITAGAKSRIGDTPYALSVINRPQRAVKLLKMNAPVIIIDNEFNCMARNFVMHKFDLLCKQL